MFKFIFLVTVLVAVSCGYDFKDSEFNQLILDDIQNIDSKRLKRDTETIVESDDWQNKFHCCNGDTYDATAFDKYVVAKDECVKELWGEGGEPSYDPFNCEQLSELKEQGICLGQCVMRNMDLIDDDENIKRDDLIEHLKIVVKHNEWNVKATEEIVDKCIASIDKDIVDEGKCSSASIDFIHCLWKGYIVSCPEDLQNNSRKCKKIRERIEKDDKIYLKKIHFFKFIHHHAHEV